MIHSFSNSLGIILFSLLSLFPDPCCFFGNHSNVGRRNGIQVNTGAVTRVYAGGDSITLSQGATPSSNGYLPRLIAYNGWTLLTNQAVGGRGVWNQTAAIQNGSWTSTDLVTMMTGLNDMKRNGAATETVNKIYGMHKAIAFKTIRGATVQSGSASVTRSGTGPFNSYAANTVGGTGVAVALPAANAASFASTVGSKWSYTFTAPGVGVQVIGSLQSLYAEGEADVHIDGNLVEHIIFGEWMDGVTDGANDNGRGPVAFMYFGLGGGSHTIEITITNAGACPIDFFSPLNPPTMSSAGTLFFEIPYCTATGYLSPPNGSIAASDICSAKIHQVAQELKNQGYNFGFANVNAPNSAYYDPNNTTDGTHPNNTGHPQIQQSAQRQLP